MPSFFYLSLFLALYKFKLCIISLFLVLYNSVQLYILCLRLFCLSLFLILYKFKLYIIVLYTYNNTIRFIHSFLYSSLPKCLSLSCFIHFVLYNFLQLYIYSELYSFIFAMERNYANFAIAYKYEFFICYMWKLPKILLKINSARAGLWDLWVGPTRPTGQMGRAKKLRYKWAKNFKPKPIYFKSWVGPTSRAKPILTALIFMFTEDLLCFDYYWLIKSLLILLLEVYGPC